MSRMTLEEIYLANLEEKRIQAHMSKEAAYEALKTLTNQDFGYDVAAWRQWFREHAATPEDTPHEEKTSM
ncbi:MAG: hypothetical protein SF029_00310 [bacterium]|nr:hypothetical protein [bacterium]